MARFKQMLLQNHGLQIYSVGSENNGIGI